MTRAKRISPAAARQAVLALLRTEGRPMTVSELFHAVGLNGPSRSAIENALVALAASGEVRRSVAGRPAKFRAVGNGE
jgi:Fe2+ or Zn2+ uptake regulation protein